MEQKILYVTDCSDGYCELEKTSLRTVLERLPSGWYSKHLECKKHGGRLIKRKTWCIECGAEIYFMIGGKTPKRCELCRQKHNKMMSSIRSVRYRNKGGERSGTSDCKWFKNICGFCVRPYFSCKMYQK